jgi:formylglycine-generating enzyme required for sulfatase activity
MGRSLNGTDACHGTNDACHAGEASAPPNGFPGELPEHHVTVSSFALDTFLVTVGRWRNFVKSYDGTPPATGAGAHPHIPGSGWDASWGSSTPAQLQGEVNCDPPTQTWTDLPADHENYPINCVPWYDAFLFCIWDGGYLPTEAEWEYAAAGGSDNRLFPWGNDDPEVNTSLATDWYSSNQSPWDRVGSRPLGNGRWGNRDMAGGMAEWVLDWYDSNWYSTGGQCCHDCANLDSTACGSCARVARGGNWESLAYLIRAAFRKAGTPNGISNGAGFRCARPAP